MNLKTMLDNAVKNFGAKTAIGMGERRMSYSQLGEESNRFAHALINMGVKKGDRVAMIQASNPVCLAFVDASAILVALPSDLFYSCWRYSIPGSSGFEENCQAL